MSKLDIGVGDEFPLDEGTPPNDEFEHRHGRKGRHRFRGHRHGHHHGHHHHHGHRHHAFLHLPLLAAVAGIAALIGAGQIAPPVSHAIMVAAVVLVLLAVVAHLWRHHRWHMNRHAP